ncbi:MAG: helix-turn-helix domain-containing protein [Turicibacter sp.]|nr:helix-turn-helix domain-containing protein [Turicibacter sp.]
MYDPLQMPALLDDDFKKLVDYKEERVDGLREFVICVWCMQPKGLERRVVKDIVLIDGCTELVVSVDTRQMCWAAPSMDKTAYNEVTKVEKRYIGVKFKPAAFTQLTGLSPELLKDRLLPIEEVDQDFCFDALDGLSFDETKEFLKAYVLKLIGDKKPNKFVSVFDDFYAAPVATVETLYQRFHLGPRQCQRHFLKNFGISPQMVLTILRFHYCLRMITKKEVAPKDMLDLIPFSDQSHFIREFKKYLGLTPYEYLQKYQEDVFLLSTSQE